jgi:hypothetical protein
MICIACVMLPRQPDFLERYGRVGGCLRDSFGSKLCEDAFDRFEDGLWRALDDHGVCFENSGQCLLAGGGQRFTFSHSLDAERLFKHRESCPGPHRVDIGSK